MSTHVGVYTFSSRQQNRVSFTKPSGVYDVRGHVEYSPLDNGFYALLGSPNGKTIMRMLLDHKSHIGYKTVERIVLVGDDKLDLSEPGG